MVGLFSLRFPCVGNGLYSFFQLHQAKLINVFSLIVGCSFLQRAFFHYIDLWQMPLHTSHNHNFILASVRFRIWLSYSAFNIATNQLPPSSSSSNLAVCHINFDSRGIGTFDSWNCNPMIAVHNQDLDKINSPAWGAICIDRLSDRTGSRNPPMYGYCCFNKFCPEAMIFLCCIFSHRWPWLTMAVLILSDDSSFVVILYFFCPINYLWQN